MDQAEQQAAIDAIARVKQAYFTGVDGKDWDGIGRVFTADAVFDRTYGNAVQDPVTGTWDPPLSPVPLLVHGRAEIVAMVRRAVERLVTRHSGRIEQIAFEDPASARVVWAMEDELHDAGGWLILRGRGHYHERYRKTEGGWLIAESRLTRLALVRGDGARG